MKKQIYTPPRTETIRVENEGIMAASNVGGSGIPDIGEGSWNTSTGGNQQDTASELEELINNILTY
ncbi:hypothetical protein D0T50_11755 [Bacteroides sp. 214]|uniref:hypothetical protein n=1 Tax=Bacteroides sp. 214 TaxID=2302935 RepID=UPI0013D61E04|nr:hypothetical protein [Bacteroides sp. 214]NDW13559.1 hypothetical protein [Bacteroides sp. 214]